MYDHDEEPAAADEQPAYDWDAWEKNRLKSGWGRWWFILMLAITVAMVLQFIVNDGRWGG